MYKQLRQSSTTMIIRQFEINKSRHPDMREIKRDCCEPEVDWFHGRSCPLSSRPSRFRKKTGSVVTDTEVILSERQNNSVKRLYCFKWFRRSWWVPGTQRRGLFSYFQDGRQWNLQRTTTF